MYKIELIGEMDDIQLFQHKHMLMVHADTVDNKIMLTKIMEKLDIKIHHPSTIKELFELRHEIIKQLNEVGYEEFHRKN